MYVRTYINVFILTLMIKIISKSKPTNIHIPICNIFYDFSFLFVIYGNTTSINEWCFVFRVKYFTWTRLAVDLTDLLSLLLKKERDNKSSLLFTCILPINFLSVIFLLSFLVVVRNSLWCNTFAKFFTVLHLKHKINKSIMAETEIISNSENNDQFFEGVEKLIEIWFTPAKNADLRKITRWVMQMFN